MSAFTEIKRIAFELSNRCVLADRHTKCPAHQKRGEPTTNLRGYTFRHVIDTMKATVPAYQGFIYFHLYNEPLCDPRLFEFVRYASRSLPRSIVQITTNGWIYDQTIHDELAEAGAKAVRFSIYSAGEYDRLSKIRPNKIKLTFSTTRQRDAAKNPAFWKADPETAANLVLRDDIPGVYSGGAIKAADGKCLAPYRQLCITSSSDIALCCMDWKRTIVFGNLIKETLPEILNSEKMRQAYRALASGNSPFEVCARCVHRERRKG